MAARGNFCTVDANGLITDRRAGRIPTKSAPGVVEMLRRSSCPACRSSSSRSRIIASCWFCAAKGWIRASIPDTDPQRPGVPPLPAGRKTRPPRRRPQPGQPVDRRGERSILAGHPPANMLTLRGFAKDPGLPALPRRVYKMRSAAVAVYPMYKGVARLVGMDVIEHDAERLPADEFEAVRQNWDKYDFFFVHIKKTDSYGEDGNFDAKVHVIETVDEALPGAAGPEPGRADHHRRPLDACSLKRHSWHRVPVLLAANTARYGKPGKFGEAACVMGTLGPIRHVDIMPLALAHSLRLGKYGA